MNKIRVLIVDDHPLIHSGMRTLLGTADDLQVVGEAATGDEAVATRSSARRSHSG
jgi:DNA-binding NarL/FixJ family response regulator